MGRKAFENLFYKGQGIESRFRLANTVLFFIMAIVMLSLTALILQNITNSVAKDYARFYSIKTIGTLNTHVNREIGLIANAARSRSIRDWFLEEANPQKRQLAYEEMMNLIRSLYSANLYFGIAATLNEYSVDVETPFNAFAPYDVLKPGRFEDLWYFECIDSERDYLLNVDVDKLKGRKLVWLNHKVVHEGQPIGVFCTGLQFDQVLQSVFGEYDSRSVRGLVLDEQGVIQMDSAMEHTRDKLIFNSSKTIQELFSQPELNDAVNAHLAGITQYFEGEPNIKVIELQSGLYSYASIAPVNGTTWSVVTLYNSSSLFNASQLLPAFFILLVMFVIYTLCLSAMNRRLLVEPFNKLVRSLEDIEEGKSNRIFGTERKDEFGRLAGTIRDMKEGLDANNMALQETMERAEQASRAKTEFLANMSHEMRTPLNAVVGMAKIARQTENREKILDCLDKIDSASTHLIAVINDILDMAKIESRKLELQSVEFDFRRMLDKTVAVAGFRMQQRHQDFHLQVDPQIPRHLVGDEQRLAQVLTNLLSNAEKFTPERGEIRLEIHLRERAHERCLLEFSVTDTGIGISQEHQEKLFESFAQADNSISRKYGGTGLGLAISKNIVQAMGGIVTLASDIGKGSRFSFTAPLGARSAGEETPQTGAPQQDSPKVVACSDPEEALPTELFAGKRILLAEDVDINREILLALLEFTGIEFVVAENGARGGAFRARS